MSELGYLFSHEKEPPKVTILPLKKLAAILVINTHIAAYDGEDSRKNYVNLLKKFPRRDITTLLASCLGIPFNDFLCMIIRPRSITKGDFEYSKSKRIGILPSGEIMKREQVKFKKLTIAIIYNKITCVKLKVHMKFVCPYISTRNDRRNTSSHHWEDLEKFDLSKNLGSLIRKVTTRPARWFKFDRCVYYIEPRAIGGFWPVNFKESVGRFLMRAMQPEPSDLKKTFELKITAYPLPKEPTNPLVTVTILDSGAKRRKLEK